MRDHPIPVSVRPVQLSLFDVPVGDVPAPTLVAPGAADVPDPDSSEPTRLLRLGQRTVTYRFRRARRRTLSVSIDDDGVRVAAPMRSPWREIEAFLASRATWILSKLDERSARPRPAPLRGMPGEQVPVQGRRLVLSVAPGRKRVWRDSTTINVALRDPSRSAGVLAALVEWMKQFTLESLTPRVEHHASRAGVRMPRLRISNALTQWGTCTQSGLIRLSWRLAQVDPALADYVVAHEVAHLLEMNHSKRFWNVVERLYPDWREAREGLNAAARELPRLVRPA